MFLLTAVLMAVCCGITYFCIVYFAPYIYLHDVSEAEPLAREASFMLTNCAREEALFYMKEMADILSGQTEDEFVFHIFRASGEEVEVLNLQIATGRKTQDFENIEKTDFYPFMLYDSEEEYILFISQNTDKESQVVEALQKSLPILSAFILIMSVTAAFFYAWYMTNPIRNISNISRRMAELDFGGLCPAGRTDEIGVLSDSLNKLSVKLSAALRELQEANQKLQADIDRERQMERQRTEFFAAASHEMKTPITIIKGQLEGMLYQVGRYKDRETYLAGSLEVVNTLEKTVRELLAISRLRTPGYTCETCSFDFSGLANERIAAYKELFLQKELTLLTSISPRVYMAGDRQLLAKVLDNLLSNAAAHSPMRNHVMVKLWKEDETVNLTIENTGVHIPEEDIPKLFEAFYRVDPSRSRQTGGSGLGLYIVKTIVDLHEGKIEVANTDRGVIARVQFLG